MYFIPNHVYHVYNRGNNKQRIFFQEKNYAFFLEKINKQLSPSCEMLCWCLMPNHFHLLVYATNKSCIERNSFGGKPMQEFAYQIGVLLSSYSQAINKQNSTTGSLFQQKTKAKCVYGQDASGGLKGYGSKTNPLITCLHYIHQNPWKAKLVNKIEDWEYSSFREYMGGTTPLKCNKELLLEMAGYDGSNLYEDSYAVIDTEVLGDGW